MGSWDVGAQAKVPGTCLLTIRVLQAHGLPSKDLVSPSDCYVTLWLPTASSHQLQTRMVKNSRNPIWNQSFHFRIHSQLKNVVQLKVFDQDFLTKDDPMLSVLFDVGTLRAGESRRESFSLNPQGEERLEVEFRLQSLTDCEQLVSNGILVVSLEPSLLPSAHAPPQACSSGPPYGRVGEALGFQFKRAHPQAYVQ